MSNSWLIEQIDQEISKLEQAKQLLIEVDKRDTRVPSSKSAQAKSAPRKRRMLSAEAKAKIAAAQRARWAKQKKTASKKVAA
jgi:hypothetical protein